MDNNKKWKNFKDFYATRSGQIYEKRYSSEIRKVEEERNNFQSKLLDFLKEKLSDEDYNIVWNYIDEFSERSNRIIGLWNEKFYNSGLNDSDKIKKEFPKLSLWNP